MARTTASPDPDAEDPTLPNRCWPWPAWWPRRSSQTRSHPELGRQTLQRPWYCASRPGRVGRRQARQGQHRSLTRHRTHHTAQGPHSPAQDAGWSSPVARQAHNLKAAGSNPAPATNTPNRQQHPPHQPRGESPRDTNAFARPRGARRSTPRIAASERSGTGQGRAGTTGGRAPPSPRPPRRAPSPRGAEGHAGRRAAMDDSGGSGGGDAALPYMRRGTAMPSIHSARDSTAKARSHRASRAARSASPAARTGHSV